MAHLARRLEPSQAGPEAAVGQHENLGRLGRQRGAGRPSRRVWREAEKSAERRGSDLQAPVGGLATGGPPPAILPSAEAEVLRFRTPQIHRGPGAARTTGVSSLLLSEGVDDVHSGLLHDQPIGVLSRWFGPRARAESDDQAAAGAQLPQIADTSCG